MNLKNIDIFRPESLLIFYSLFLVLVVLSLFTGLLIKPPSALSFILILVTFPFFVAGVRFGFNASGKKVALPLYFVVSLIITGLYTLVFTSFLQIPLWQSALSCLALLFVPSLLLYHFRAKLKVPRKVPLLLIALGVVLIFLTFLNIGGVPLLNTSLRATALENPLWGAALLSFLTGYALILPQLKSKKILFLVVLAAVILFSLMAFRAPLMIVLLAGLFTAYYRKNLGKRSVLAALLVALVLIALLGYLVAPLVGPFQLLLYRAGTTHSVFDSIVQQSFPLGQEHGTFFLNGNPRAHVGSLLGADTTLTYTLLGASFMDFGLSGAVLWMLLLGFLLGLAYTSMKKDDILSGFYPLLFAISLVWIEIGPDPFQLLFFWMFLFLYMTRNS